MRILFLLKIQINEIKDKISSILEKLCPVITTITGIGNILETSIYSEIGDISRFKKTSQLVAYARLDTCIAQSGYFTVTNTKISKHGSPYLKKSIWLAATVVAFKDSILSTYYNGLMHRWKAYSTAIGNVS